MPFVLSHFEAEIKRQMRDGVEIIAPGDLPVMLRKALETYSRKRPRDVVVDIPSDGTGDFAVSSLTGFDQNLSGDVTIEYPISAAGEEPNFVDRREWRFYDKPDGRVVRVFGIPNGNQVRFSFKGVHSVTTLASTVPESDFYAVCKLAAAEGLSELATHFVQTTEVNSFVNADVSNYQSKPDQYSKRAAQLRKEANDHLGLGKEEMGAQPASVTKNLDTQGSTGRDWLTHPRNRR